MLSVVPSASAEGGAGALSDTHKRIFAQFLPDSQSDQVCQSPAWATGLSANFTNTKGISFAPYGDTRSLDKIKTQIQEYGSNVPISGDRLSLMVDYFDTNTELYHTMMNRIFACSLIQAREQVYAQYLNPKDSSVRLPRDSRFKETLEALREKNQKERSAYGCMQVSPSNTEPIVDHGGLSSDTESKAQLINAATYMSCRYQAYIEYSRVFLTMPDAQLLMTKRAALGDEESDAVLFSPIELSIEGVLAAQDMMTRRLDSADGLPLKVVPQTFASTLSYQKAYEIHLLLLLVRDQYIVMRKNLDDALSPFTQWIYKAHNVSAPGR